MSRIVTGFTDFIKEEDDEVQQSITSAKTSLKQVAAPFKKIKWEQGTKNIDIGGGRFNLASEFMKQLGAENHVYDPFNRSKEHNEMVAQQAPYDTGTMFNVLNVIPEEPAQIKALENFKKFVKPGGKVYISVWVGDKTGEGKETKSGYQHNKKLNDYLPLIQKVFPNVSKKNGFFEATV